MAKETEYRGSCCNSSSQGNEVPIEGKPILGSVGEFLVNVGIHVYHGCPTVPADVLEHRQSICQNCRFKKGNFCLACNCYLPEKTKWADQECPRGEWNQHDFKR